MLKRILMTFLSLLAFIACKTKGNTEGNIQVEDLKNSKSSYILIDVRTAEEYSEGYIKGANNLNVSADNFENKIASLDKTKDYIVYCRSGFRSLKAQKIMIDKGFKSVKSLEGGYLKYIK